MYHIFFIRKQTKWVSEGYLLCFAQQTNRPNVLHKQTYYVWNMFSKLTYYVLLCKLIGYISQHGLKVYIQLVNIHFFHF